MTQQAARTRPQPIASGRSLAYGDVPMIGLPRSLATIVVALTLTLATAARANVYAGKAWSDYGPVTRYRVVIHPAPRFSKGPAGYYATGNCTAPHPGFRCLVPFTSVAVVFSPDGQFYAIIGNDVCEASGFGASYAGPLNGDYVCADGDAGTLYLRRVR